MKNESRVEVPTFQIWKVPASQVAHFMRRNWGKALTAPALMIDEIRGVALARRAFEKVATIVVQDTRVEDRQLKYNLKRLSEIHSDGYTPDIENYSDEEMEDAIRDARETAARFVAEYVSRESIEFVQNGKMWFVLMRVKRTQEGEWE